MPIDDGTNLQEAIVRKNQALFETFGIASNTAEAIGVRLSYLRESPAKPIAQPQVLL